MTPKDPGLYWLWEFGEDPHLVRVDIELDSHGLFFVRIPGDECKYPIDLWMDAIWIGPVGNNPTTHSIEN